MRPVNLADLEAGVRVLLAAPQRSRRQLALSLCNAAAAADAHRKRTGAPHPVFGTGTIMSASRCYAMVSSQGADEGDYLTALRDLITALIHQRA